MQVEVKSRPEPREKRMLTRVNSYAIVGLEGAIIEVEVDISPA